MPEMRKSKTLVLGNDQGGAFVSEYKSMLSNLTYPVAADWLLDLTDAQVECLVRDLGDKLRVCDPFGAANNNVESVLPPFRP